jgi:hypothetical protein
LRWPGGMRAGRTPGRQDCLRRAGGRLDCPRPPSLAGSGSVSAHCWRGTSESMAGPRRTPWRPGRTLAGVLPQMTRIVSPTYLLSYRFGGPPSRRPGGRQGGLGAPWRATGALLQEPDSDASGASPGRRPRPLPTITWALARTVLLRASWRTCRCSAHQVIDKVIDSPGYRFTRAAVACRAGLAETGAVCPRPSVLAT